VSHPKTDPLWFEFRNAIFARNFEAAEALLKANPQLHTLRNSLGETVLHFFAVENDLQGVAWLHERGFDLNEKTDFGTPIIFEVAQLGYKELVLWFAQQGADLGALDRANKNIVAYLKAYERGDMVEFIKEKVPNAPL